MLVSGPGRNVVRRSPRCAECAARNRSCEYRPGQDVEHEQCLRCAHWDRPCLPSVPLEARPLLKVPLTRRARGRPPRAVASAVSTTTPNAYGVAHEQTYSAAYQVLQQTLARLDELRAGQPRCETCDSGTQTDGTLTPPPEEEAPGLDEIYREDFPMYQFPFAIDPREVDFSLSNVYFGDLSGHINVDN